MAIKRTAKNLADFCNSVVGAPYWFGCFGQKANASLYNSKKAQYSTYYQFPKNTYTDDYGKRVTDCAGLVKWFLWSNNMTDKSPTYKASEDWGATTFYNKCAKKGSISSLPANKIGILVFKGNSKTKSHMGVIVDNAGNVVDARGHNYGTVKNTKASSWGYWGQCNLIDYSEQPQPAPTPTPTPAPTPAPAPKPTAKRYQVVCKKGLNVRTGPGKKYTDVGDINYGSYVTVYEIKNNWGKIDPSKSRWACIKEGDTVYMKAV